MVCRKINMIKRKTKERFTNNISFLVSDSMLIKLEEAAETQQRSKSVLIRNALDMLISLMEEEENRG